MKSKTRIVAVLLAVLTVLALAPLALAATGATITIPHGATRRFEFYRKNNDQWNTIDTSYMYNDFTAVTSGDEKIAKIVDQNGVFQIVGYSRGMTTYSATTAGGETYSGIISVIDPAPPEKGGGGGVNIGGSGITNPLEGSLFLPLGETAYKVPVPVGALTGGEWSSNNESVIKIDKTSAQVNALGIGQATLSYTYGDNKVKTIPVYVSSNDFEFRVEYLTGYTGSGYNLSNPYMQGYYGGGTDNYGRILLLFHNGKTNDITFSATGDIEVGAQSGVFTKRGSPSAWGQGYGYNEWRGTIIMTSPTMGTKYVNVRLR